MATHKLLLLAGDGIGPEVMTEVVKVADWLGKQGVASFESETGLVGGAAYDAHGKSISESDMKLAMECDAVIFGAGAPRLPNTSCFALPGLQAETLLIALDLAGFAVSSGSACSSGKVRPSHVLEAMGVGADLAKCALRVSLGWSTRESDLERFCETFQKTVWTIRERRGSRA